jgi:hypothetical protein
MRTKIVYSCLEDPWIESHMDAIKTMPPVESSRLVVKTGLPQMTDSVNVPGEEVGLPGLRQRLYMNVTNIYDSQDLAPKSPERA